MSDSEPSEARQRPEPAPLLEETGLTSDLDRNRLSGALPDGHDQAAPDDEETAASAPSADDEIEGLDEKGAPWGDYPIDSILIRQEPRTVLDVVRRINRGTYILNPDFQRDFLWDVPTQSKLIESILMRIPLPVLYLAENDDGKVVVVDGLQRLTTFQRFLDNQLKLRLPDRTDLDGKRFSDLPEKLQNRVEDCSLTLYSIDSKVPDRARLDIFDRVNSGVPLTRQQMRNCLYMGPAGVVTLGIRTSDDTDFHRPVHTGFGLTQVLPIVVAALSADHDALLLIENPEVHLHPSAQARMGHFLAEVAAAGVEPALRRAPQHVPVPFLSWLTKGGPFWDDSRRHGSGEWLECRGEVVPDSSVGEAVYRAITGFSCALVSLKPPDWDYAPVRVSHRLGDEEPPAEHADLPNWRDLDALEEGLRTAPPSVRAWKDLQREIRRYPNLRFAPDCMDPLVGLPFSHGAAREILKRLDVLNRFAGLRDATDEKKELLRNRFVGQKAWFSDSSDQREGEVPREDDL